MADQKLVPMVIFRKSPDHVRHDAYPELEGKVFPTIKVNCGPLVHDFHAFHGPAVDDTPAGRNEGREQMAQYLVQKTAAENEPIDG